ncbi:hypothetical protein QNI19_08695 [Cytophagaceae bacterium DM2B3-1]|uniref:Uncharacterized protein n=1 Tax=Xanthocytophaga flava TaxID=3048013 RepID=A0ABT7CGZ2_9BACT|nr:hypothetical protein [Xanthocytophaga flavus]MDJ1493008.1 hypothetical protein [Xanthocytophaga flavus]
MSSYQTYGQLYEAFINWVLTNNAHQFSSVENTIVNASQMIELIEAEQNGENWQKIGRLGQVVKDQILLTLVVLYQTEEYEWKKDLLVRLIGQTKQASSSDEYIYILNETITTTYSL